MRVLTSKKSTGQRGRRQVEPVSIDDYESFFLIRSGNRNSERREIREPNPPSSSIFKVNK